MITKSIFFKNFRLKTNNKSIKKDLKLLIKKNDDILHSLSTKYKNSYSKKTILSLKKYFHIKIIGMGGSILGAEAIYDFLKHKVKKNFYFINNLKSKNNLNNKKNKSLSIIISKSGNTLETISNTNIYLKNKEKSIFITENKTSYLSNIAKKLKSEIIHHNNFIGGRYSVLSEVGMLPSELMGLKTSQFKQMNNLIKNKEFINSLTKNVSNTLHLVKKKKFNSIILNYDEKSDNLFKWYQQLIAESLGKKGNGILPIISSMPKDNHSTMQLYLDGPKNNFFTFFYVKNDSSPKINSNKILSSHSYLKNKTLDEIKFAQKIATEKVFFKKNLPYRSFEIIKRNEKSLGELFCFFILETILLGRALKINPYDQPSVELIKQETSKILI
ncbi:SIS domain-containing protein [Candidatus Pelagibacter sp. Uisw_099_02]|uniref:SIS domain-containing protein n=1 Tax=Candidatus Pelagibacter sp. Uisw_099_02 TaxID=3230981 RepID=UPI0039EA7718